MKNFEVRYTLFQNNWTSFDESDYFDTQEEAIECANNNDTLEYYTDGNNCWYNNGRQCQVFNSAGESIYIAPGVDTTCYTDQEDEMSMPVKIGEKRSRKDGESILDYYFYLSGGDLAETDEEKNGCAINALGRCSRAGICDYREAVRPDGGSNFIYTFYRKNGDTMPSLNFPLPPNFIISLH